FSRDWSSDVCSSDLERDAFRHVAPDVLLRFLARPQLLAKRWTVVRVVLFAGNDGDVGIGVHLANTMQGRGSAHAATDDEVGMMGHGDLLCSALPMGQR